MTTTPNPTAEQVIDRALKDHKGRYHPVNERTAAFIEDELLYFGLLSEGAPSEIQIERALDALSRFNQWTDNPRGAMRAALTAAGATPQTVIDEAALTGVVFNAVEKWADMYPTPQVSEMIARAVAAWLRDGAAAQEPLVLDPEKVTHFMVDHREAASATGGDAACACDRTWRNYREHAEHKATALCEAYTEGKLT